MRKKGEKDNLAEVKGVGSWENFIDAVIPSVPGLRQANHFHPLLATKSSFVSLKGAAVPLALVYTSGYFEG